MSNIILKIIAKRDERVFKKGDVITFNLIKGSVNYLVGPNGSGKSTILHAIRAYKDSVFENLDWNLCMETSRGLDINTYKGVFDIEGLENFKWVFSLDAVEDNPLHFMKAATATALISGGGLTLSNKSRGEGTKFLFSRLINSMIKITGASLSNGKITNTPEEHSLIIIDEMDEGFDLKSQSTYHRLLNNLCNVFNATIICVCHNPLCILYDPIGVLRPLLDMTDRKIKVISEYIEQQTNKHIVMFDPNKYNEYNEYILWKTKNTTKK